MKTNEVLETIKARRSVRAYDRKQIPADDLNAILEAGAYAPSGMHYETWHFTAVRNTVKLEELNSFEERVKKYDDKFMKIRVQEQGTVRAIREVQAEITKIRGEITRSNQMISSYQEDIKHQEGIQLRCNSESERSAAPARSSRPRPAP